MRRLVATLIVLVLSAPAVSWGGTVLPGAIAFVGSVGCCGPAKDAQEPTSDTRLNKVCCCKPSPAEPGVDGTDLFLNPDEGAVMPTLAAAPLFAIIAPIAPRVVTPRAPARAPPPERPLFAQHTSLLI